MLLTSPAGNDLLFDDKLCEQGRNFANKIWNAFRLARMGGRRSNGSTGSSGYGRGVDGSPKPAGHGRVGRGIRELPLE